MVPFGRRDTGHVGSGVDMPPRISIIGKWRLWLAGLLRPVKPGKEPKEKSSSSRGRRHVSRR